MKREKTNNRKFLALALFLISFIFSLGFTFAVSSTSVYSVQYFPPSVTGQFSSLMSGPTSSFSGTTTGENEFFDMQVIIPPLGCQPYVVRSDLLEEQNVPVFCQLVPIKINPGIDITRIDSISVVQKSNSPYISGVGFYPANSAIKSKYGVTGVPSGENIGYV
ncbi:MAG: hypothetical protein Q8L27_02825, partial [archaeon]|nr:hypothetical protein [archaeon]